MVQYDKFGPEDFATDEYFRMWVLKPDHSAMRFWEEWLRKNPHKETAVAQARQLILAVHNDAVIAYPDAIERMWNHIEARTNDLAPALYREAKLTSYWLSGPLRIAAGLLFLVVAGLTIYYSGILNGQSVYTTGFGEIRTIRLPDGSEAVLNANSSLRFAPDWEDETVREVELQGEAFFSVRQMKIRSAGKITPVKFAVTTPDLRVEVLGTQFNVNNRRNRTDVSLKSGKIQLALNAGTASPPLLMEPGDFLSYSSKGKKIIRETIATNRVDTWRHKRWVYHNASLQEVALQLEETYGFPVRWEDDTLKNRKVSGVVPTDHLEAVLQALSLTLNLRISKSGNDIIIAR
jgi:ferric-dicitrate binding protein FerR (iron transport regulator)